MPSKIAGISQFLFKGSTAPGHFVEDDSKLGSTLTGLLRAEITFAEAAPDVGYIHRRTKDADIYFIANTSNTEKTVTATLQSQGKAAEIWNPLTGNVRSAFVANRTDGDTTLSLRLDPYGSNVIVLSRTSTQVDKLTMGAGRIIDLSTGWNVSFGTSGATTRMETLKSWTEDDATRYFSGSVTYEKEVDVPSAMIASDITPVLSFGEGKALPVQNVRSGMQTFYDPPIREAAVIFINGQRAGSLWCPPYRLAIPDLLRAGKNQIKIVVANTAQNYLAGHSLPDYRLLSLRYGERFQAQDMDKIQALPSGLLGPIELLGVPK